MNIENKEGTHQNINRRRSRDHQKQSETNAGCH